MSKLIVAFAVLAIAGCTTTVKTHAEHGVKGLEVDCSGIGAQWESCYSRAEEECKGAGYKILAKSDDPGEAGDYLFGFNPAGMVTRTIVVICR